jgi:hypothetical protein
MRQTKSATGITLTAILTLALIFSVSGPVNAEKYEPPMEMVSIGSHASGSVYVVFLAAWSKVLNESFKNFSANVEAGGSTKNIMLVSNKQTEFGMTTGTQAYMGYWGLGFAQGKKYDDIRALFPAYPAIFAAWVLEDSDIEKFPEDLNGKVVCFGARGSLTDLMMRSMIEKFDIKPKRIVNSSWADTSNLMADGLVDITINIGGHPAGFVKELEVRHDLRFLRLSEDFKKKFLEAFPYYGLGTLPDVYKAMKGPHEDTLLTMNFVFTNKDLSEEFIYNVVKTTWENIEQIRSVKPGLFSWTDYESLKYIPIKFHKGAIKYYKEKGIELPEPVPGPQE